MYIEFSGLLHHRSVSFEPGPCAGASDRVIHVVLRKAGPAKERSVLGRAAPRESGLTMPVLEVYVEPVVQENRSCLGSGRRPRSASLHPARPGSFSLRPDARWFLWARACRGRFASVHRAPRSVSPLIKAATASKHWTSSVSISGLITGMSVQASRPSPLQDQKGRILPSRYRRGPHRGRQALDLLVPRPHLEIGIREAGTEVGRHGGRLP